VRGDQALSQGVRRCHLTGRCAIAGNSGGSGSAADRPWWILYLSLLVAGLLLIADGFHVAHLHRWTAKLGIALAYSAFVLFVGEGRTLAVVSAGLVCSAVLATFLW